MKLSRHGYSFPEVLFAVVVLGIGFIMIAAIFPVAIAQSKQTLDETSAAAISRAAVNALARFGDDQHYSVAGQNVNAALMLPATGTLALNWQGEVRPFDTNQGWNSIAHNMIIPQDPRYAFVPLYRRDGDPNFLAPAVQAAGNAQVFVIVCALRGITDPRQELAYGRSSGFGQDIDLNVPTVGQNQSINNPNNLYPRQIHIASLTNNYQNTGVDIVQLDPTTNPNVGNANENFPEALAEGAFIVMRAPITLPATGNQRFFNYRVGTPRPDIAVTPSGYPAAWELMPGNDMLDNNENVTTPVFAWCVGRERRQVGNNQYTFVGAAQDVSMFTIYIKVNP